MKTIELEKSGDEVHKSDEMVADADAWSSETGKIDLSRML